jgi:hypothetical protein
MVVAAAGSGSITAWWITVLVGAVPGAAAIVSAVMAGRAAQRARVAEAETARLRELEARLAGRKYDTYKPMVDLYREILDAANANTGVSAPDLPDMLRRLS